LLKIDGITIITNLPYGHRSKSFISDAVLKNSFERFGNLIKKSYLKLENVFIIYPIERTRPNFIEISNLPWNLLMEFDNSGIKVGLWHLDKDRIQNNVDFNEEKKRGYYF
jgi:hypothetical protein